MKSIVKVWPLRTDLHGCDALGKPVILTPGLAGWMQHEEAYAAKATGDVQIMAGLRPQDLMQPGQARALKAEEATKAPTKKPAAKTRTYRRRDMQADPAGMADDRED